MGTVLRAAVALALTLVAAPAVPAAQAGACVEEATYTFSPPLGLATTTGIVTVTFSRGPCVFAGAGGGSFSTSYVGSCLSVTFGAQGTVTLLGGTVWVEVDPGALKAKVMVLVPTEGVCPTPSLTGGGLWVDA